MSLVSVVNIPNQGMCRKMSVVDGSGKRIDGWFPVPMQPFTTNIVGVGMCHRILAYDINGQRMDVWSPMPSGSVNKKVVLPVKK